MSKVIWNGNILNWEIKAADTFLSRLIGWMGRREINSNDALLIKPCNRIHTFGMRTSIDVLFIDHSGTILHCIEHMRPNHLSPYINGARSVIETSAGTIQRMNILKGDNIIIQEDHDFT